MKFLKSKMLVSAALSILSLLWFSSCQQQMKEYYEEPEWIKGSIYEILQDRGDYTLFLQGVDTCQYTALLKGRSILTVMAPTDSSLEAYLQRHYGSPDWSAVPTAEVKKLIGFHILYYAFDQDKLSNFRPKEGDGASAEELEKNAGLYYKFRTRSQDVPERISVSRWMNGTTLDTLPHEVDVYHLERFIPVFSANMFQTKLIDAKTNYEYFFPGSEWKAGTVFNVCDAEVTEMEVIAKNGYIYFVDRVIEPLETIHKELESDEAYSMYLNFYDKYAYYAVEENLTDLYGGGSTTYYECLYEKASGKFSLPNIAQEWPVSDYSKMSTLSFTSNTLFAPTNEAFNEFYLSYWGIPGTGYPAQVNYDSVSSDAVAYLLSNSFYEGSFVFPDEISRGDILNKFTNTAITFDVNKVPEANRKVCVNGALYGLSEITPPAVFGMVTGPAYQYKRYSNFLKMLTASGMENTLTSDAVNYIMLYPNNDQLAANYIWYDATTDKLKNGVVGDATQPNLGSAEQGRYVNAHIVSVDNMRPLTATGDIQVLRTLSPDYKLYWYVSPDGKISNSFKYNSLIQYAGHMEVSKDSVYTDVRELAFRDAPWQNGYCYEYDTQNSRFLLSGSNAEALIQNFVPFMWLHRNDEATLFQGFIKVLGLANLMDEEAMTMNFMNENCLILIPTTQAVKTAIVEGRFPYLSVPAGTTTDEPLFWDLVSAPADGSAAQDSFQHYMLEYFLPESMSPALDYPYYKWGVDIEADGGYASIADLSGTMAAQVYVYIYDHGDAGLTAKVAGMDTEIPFYAAYDYLPFVFDDACVHFIDGIFEDKWPHGIQ